MRAMGGAPAAAVLVFACAIAAAPARANDSTAEVAIGGLTLTKSGAISMDSEDLYISGDIVRVKYRFTNTTDAPIDTLVAFPLPDILPYGDMEAKLHVCHVWGDPVSDLKFKTSVDGQPLALQLVEQAFFKGRDVSARLSALRIPLNPYGNDFGTAIDRLPKTDRDRLVADGLIRYDNDREHDTDPVWRERWARRMTPTRHQIFPSRKTITVEHEYAPKVGGGSGFPGEFDPMDRTTEARRKYCIDDAWLLSFDNKAEDWKRSAFETTVGYVLKTGANWKGPIGDFRLVVDKGKPDSLVSFCAEGVKQISPTQFEVRHANFTPKEDLDILIIDLGRLR